MTCRPGADTTTDTGHGNVILTDATGQRGTMDTTTGSLDQSAVRAPTPAHAWRLAFSPARVRRDLPTRATLRRPRVPRPRSQLFPPFPLVQAGPPLLQEVLPKAGLVYSEKGNLSEVLCKPKVMAIKSPSLEKLEELERMARDLEVSPRFRCRPPVIAHPLRCRLLPACALTGRAVGCWRSSRCRRRLRPRRRPRGSRRVSGRELATSFACVTFMGVRILHERRALLHHQPEHFIHPRLLRMTDHPSPPPPASPAVKQPCVSNALFIHRGRLKHRRRPSPQGRCAQTEGASGVLARPAAAVVSSAPPPHPP